MISVRMDSVHNEILQRQNNRNKVINKQVSVSYERIQKMYATANYFYNYIHHPDDIRVPLDHTLIKKVK